YYELAANQGNSAAQNNLGYLYKNHFKDYEKSKYYYELVANQGYSIAQHNLGYLYDYHFKDYEKAKYYYELAANQGNKDAKHLLYKLYCKLDDYENALYWYNEYYDNEIKIDNIKNDPLLSDYIINNYFKLKDENKILKSELLKYKIDVNELEYNFINNNAIIKKNEKINLLIKWM